MQMHVRQNPSNPSLYTVNGRQHSFGYRPSLPNTVQSLLVSTKAIQDALTRWAARQASEDVVSNCYVTFGSQFNAAVEAFGWFGIDTSDIHTIPSRLRVILEDCLGDEPCEQTLDAYMPDVRQLMYDLLQGLRAKQAAWRAVQTREWSHGSGSASGSSDNH